MNIHPLLTKLKNKHATEIYVLNCYSKYEVGAIKPIISLHSTKYGVSNAYQKYVSKKPKTKWYDNGSDENHIHLEDTDAGTAYGENFIDIIIKTLDI